MGYLTPDTLPNSRACRTLRIPDSSEWLAIVSGALLELTKPWNWQEYGSISIDDAVDAVWAILDGYYQGSACMIGAILPYATNTVPNGTLPCDGSIYDRSDYPSLYDALDSAYIVDASQFRTPNLSGRVVVGSGQGSGLTSRTIGDSNGEEDHTLTEAEMPAHSHVIMLSGIVVAPGAIPDNVVGGTLPVGGTNSTGGSGPHNNMQPYHVLRYCIVAE